jgi:HAD superfamily hydrolase (TIGR01509 family)
MPIKSKVFRAVLWDMDGTLIDSEPIWQEEELELARVNSIPWSEADSQNCIGGPISRVDSYMRERAPGRFKEAELSNKLIARIADRLSEGVDFAPGAKVLIDEMISLNLKLGLVTASARVIVDAALPSIGHIFQTVVSADDVALPKPDPSGYIKAAADLGAPIEECLIIEDSPNGMRAAIASGGWVLGLSHGKELPRSPRARYVPSLDGVTFERICNLFGESQDDSETKY